MLMRVFSRYEKDLLGLYDEWESLTAERGSLSSFSTSIFHGAHQQFVCRSRADEPGIPEVPR